MDRFRPLLVAARLDRALLAPCAVFIGSSFARFDAQPGPGLPAHLAVSLGALAAGIGVNLIDHAWDRLGAPPPDPRKPMPESDAPLDARDAAIAGAVALGIALLASIALAPLSGSAAIGWGAFAVALGALRGAPAIGLDTLGPGLGDLADVLALGPLAAVAGYASQSGAGGMGAAIIGIPAGLACAAPLFARHFTRPEANRRLERIVPVTARWGFVALPALAALSVVALVQLGEAPRGVLAAIVPLAAAAAIGARLPNTAEPETFERAARSLAVVVLVTLLTFSIALRLAART